jgi:hypothetical protein
LQIQFVCPSSLSLSRSLSLSFSPPHIMKYSVMPMNSSLSFQNDSKCIQVSHQRSAALQHWIAIRGFGNSVDPLFYSFCTSTRLISAYLRLLARWHSHEHGGQCHQPPGNHRTWLTHFRISFAKGHFH